MGVVVRALDVAPQDAELVALGIGQRHPATAVGTTMIGILRRAKSKNPLDLILAADDREDAGRSAGGS